MKIVRGPAEYRKPLNVGLMFFNDDPEDYFSCARIEIVDKPDPTGKGMTEKTFRGPLDKQLQDALSYIKNYIIKERVTKIPDSELAVRAFNWPYAAVEEALSNAVYHKSYQIHEPITVLITPGKMEITSLPGPDRSISDEDLAQRKLVSRRYRNRRIGDFLKELNIVEGRNTGIPTIIESMRINGSGLPSFETDEDRSYFVTILPIHPDFLSNGKEGQSYIKSEGSGNNKKRRSKAEIESLIINILKEKGNMSTNEIASELGYKKLNDITRFVVNKLIESKNVAYLYPDKPRSRNQKLCLLQAEKKKYQTNESGRRRSG